MQYGDILIENSDAYGETIRFANFGIDDAGPNARHVRYAHANIAPILRGGGSVHLMGLTSRSGSADHNRRLAQRRIDSVVALLRNAAGNRFQVVSTIAAGEIVAAAAGIENDIEDSRWRAVLMTYWLREKPPPVPKPSSRPSLMLKRYRAKNVHLPEKQAALDASAAEDWAIISQVWFAVRYPELRVTEHNPIEVPALGWELRTIIIRDRRLRSDFAKVRWIEFDFRWAEGNSGPVTVIEETGLPMRGSASHRVVSASEGADIYHNPWKYTPLGNAADVFLLRHLVPPLSGFGQAGAEPRR
jgi:hypothetical protein